MSKSRKVLLEKRDYYRVLLTDVLPYEIPFILTNEGFYTYMKDRVPQNAFIKKILDVNNRSETKPLAYKIMKDANSNRELDLIHPRVQLQMCNLYKDYNQLITHLATRSSYSLRHPSKIALSYYEKCKDKDSHDEKYKDEGVSIDGNKEPVYASTFFEYKDVSFLYKFYDSYQFHRIEKKFQYQFKFDIAKCFASISTFQLSKSLRDLESYNKSRGHYSFESVFENIMNIANFGNSHGIVIGPEFSRIFAEILMQSIDVSIKRKLVEKQIIENSDYVIKRYVDDYFLFYNNESNRKEIFNIVQDELQKFKLYCNESKSKVTKIPFITGVTIAKQQYSDLIQRLFLKFDYIDENKDKKGIIHPFNRYYKTANKLITDIKCIVFNNDINYSSITGYYFTLVRIKVAEIESCVEDYRNIQEQHDRITNFLLIIIELSFFMYSMDFRVRSTYLISQIIIIINRIASNLDVSNFELLKKKIYEEAYLLIRSATNKEALKDIECLNLLIAIRDIDTEYQLSPDIIEDILNINDFSSTNYFDLMTCLYYVQNKSPYTKIRSQVVKIIKMKLSDNYLTILNDSELAHLFFDSIRCPYLTNKMKLEIARQALSCFTGITDDEVINTMEHIKSRNWFIDWDIDSSEAIEKLLKKKELKMSYEN